MLDIKLIRTNPDLVKENIKKKFQDEKLPLVDEVLELDAEFRASKGRGDELRQQRNAISKEIGKLMGQGKKEEAEEVKKQVQAIAGELEEMERKEAEMTAEIRKRMLVIPNLIDDSVPIGKDDSENVEVQRFGEPVVPDFEVPYHTEIMERFGGIDLDSARKTSGNGFYYLMGRHRPAALGGALLRPGLYDRQGLYLLHPALYDPRQRGGGRHVPDRHGRHDVQDRGGGPVPDRHQRALHDRQVHRHHPARGAPCPRP